MMIALAGIIALISLFFFASVAQAQTFKVGSFVKTTGGAPASQAVPHGLGMTPKALILWNSGIPELGNSGIEELSNERPRTNVE